MTSGQLTISTSRGRRRATYHLLTPPNRYPSRLAGWQATTIFKLATPRTCTARFGQYLLELDAGGGSIERVDPEYEHFVLTLSGEASLDGDRVSKGTYAYVPPGAGLAIAHANADSREPARLMWIKRRYEPVPSHTAPIPCRGRVDELPADTADTGLIRRELLPADDPAYDFNMSLLTFPPGSRLAQVELHDEEHGLYMTKGGGTYYVDGDSHEVVEGDFLYMAPYCPQFFRPQGPDDAEYLLYKDVYRDGF